MVRTVQWANTVYVTVKVKGVSSERWRDGVREGRREGGKERERERVGRGGRRMREKGRKESGR
jgi:hypothetical protein